MELCDAPNNVHVFSSRYNVRGNMLLLKMIPRTNRWNIHPISDKNGKLCTLFQTRNAWKWYPLGWHIPIWLSYIYETPPPPPQTGPDSTMVSYFLTCWQLSQLLSDRSYYTMWGKRVTPYIIFLVRVQHDVRVSIKELAIVRLGPVRHLISKYSRTANNNEDGQATKIQVRIS